MVVHRQAVAALGGSDCEGWHPGMLHQPVNSLSSLAYLVAGAWVVTRPDGDRACRLRGVVYAGGVTGTGIGSLLYHGPQWPGSAVVHNAAIPAVLLFIAVEDFALLRGWKIRRQMTAYAVAVGAACLLVAAVPATSNTVAALSTALAAAAEIVLARQVGQLPTRAALGFAATILAAGLAGLAGRTGSPLCRPDSLLQGHALWHVLTAGALLGWDRVRRARTVPR